MNYTNDEKYILKSALDREQTWREKQLLKEMRKRTHRDRENITYWMKNVKTIRSLRKKLEEDKIFIKNSDNYGDLKELIELNDKIMKKWDFLLEK